MLLANAKTSECVLQELKFVGYVLEEEGIKLVLKNIRAIQKYGWRKDIDLGGQLGGWCCRELLIPTTNIYIIF
jgi:hypothetical protein